MSDNKSGFEDDPMYKESCRHREHNPPSHILVPTGKIYRHVCPLCGKEAIIRSQQNWGC